MKKILLILAAPLALGYSAFSQAPFEFNSKEITTTTPGTDPDDVSDELIIPNKLKNTSESTFKFNWRLLNPGDRPSGWTLSGFCDNNICYTSGWQGGEEKESYDLAPGELSDFKLQLKLPQGIASDATAAFKFEAKVGDYRDTAIFIVTKSSTGINLISVDDTRINIFPNPNQDDQINIYVARELNAEKINVYNMLGRLVYTQRTSGTDEFNMMNVQSLSNGLHIIQVIDNNNQVLSSRKFEKR